VQSKEQSDSRLTIRDRRRERPRGSNSGVESQPSKLLVAGSNPVSRSNALGVRRKAPGEGLTRNENEAMSKIRSPGASRRVSHGVEAHVAQLVEHVLGKDEVTSSILVVGSK
jgi:hypothetical protein